MSRVDQLVRQYQQGESCEELIHIYHPFLLKYHKMLTLCMIDLRSYDLRRFIACYMSNQGLRLGLLRGKFRSKESIKDAYRIVHKLRKAIDGYTFLFPKQLHYPYDEVFDELVILFLKLAKGYQDMGRGFGYYLETHYRYELKRWIDDKTVDAKATMEYDDPFQQTEERISIDSTLSMKHLDKPLGLEIDEDMDLNNILWLNGVVCGDLFKELSYSERYVLVKYYQDKWSDQEIARQTGFHAVSINRMRHRLLEHFRDLRKRGEMKWIR
jgi:hypothetical protein